MKVLSIRTAVLVYLLFCFTSCSVVRKISVVNTLTNSNAPGELIIPKVLDLGGDTLRVGPSKTLKFAGGTIKNGVVIFQENEIKGTPLFQNVKIVGTIRNKQIYSNWFSHHDDNDNLLIDAIKVACNSSCTFVFNEGRYRFTDYIPLYGKCNLIAEGNVILDVAINSKQIFILAGNTKIGSKNPVTWEGRISGLNIVIEKGVYDNFIGLYNVRNAEISNCKIDASANGVDCRNKLIGSVNNANYANPSFGDNIRIINNTIKVHASLDDRNNCECIGIANRNNILIEGNNIYNTRDDLGVHTSTNVRIANNKIYSYDGRIFISNSKDVVIEDNELSYVFPSSSGMGIFVGQENENVPLSERIFIKGNIVDYTRAKDTPCYGIRVIGASHVNIEDNIVKGHKTARISIEYVEDHNYVYEGALLNEGLIVPEHILVRNNVCNGMWLPGYNTLQINDIQFINNMIDGVISITNHDVIYLDNKLGEHANPIAYPKPQNKKK